MPCPSPQRRCGWLRRRYCVGSSASQSDGPSSAKPKTSSSSGAGTSSGDTQDTSSGAGAATSSGAVSGAGDDSGADAASSEDGGGDASASLDGGGDAAIGGDCQPGDTTPCASFTTPTGTTIQLGPYGAQMDMNVGKGFENTVQSGDMPGNESTCQFFVDVFMEDPNLGTKLLQTTTDSGVALDFSLYTVYRPVVWPSGPVPVITWGNGTCAQPEGYGALLRYVASYGYVVVAANSRWVGSGTPAPMLHALDYAAAANADSTSPYYGKLDMTKVGAMGHSQGGQATATAASDSRISDVIIFNAVDSGVSKPYLTTSGDMDITNFTDTGMASAISAATVPAAWLYFHNPAGMGPLRDDVPERRRQPRHVRRNELRTLRAVVGLRIRRELAPQVARPRDRSEGADEAEGGAALRGRHGRLDVNEARIATPHRRQSLDGRLDEERRRERRGTEHDSGAAEDARVEAVGRPRAEHAPEQPEAMMDARSKRRLAHAEGGRHLFVSELLAVPEHDGLAHPVREAGERVAHAAPSLFEEELVNLARGRDTPPRAPRSRRAGEQRRVVSRDCDSDCGPP